ncbi:hypothetical protein S83_066170 [Arachis hypogaea]
MEEIFVPFRGIKNDLQGRFMGYKQDWIGGLNAGFSNSRYFIWRTIGKRYRWRPASVDSRSCGTNCDYVYIHVQFR